MAFNQTTAAKISSVFRETGDLHLIDVDIIGSKEEAVNHDFTKMSREERGELKTKLKNEGRGEQLTFNHSNV
jgi:hypothetical protein